MNKDIEEINLLKKYGWIVSTEDKNDQANLAGLILPLHEFLQKFDIANVYLTSSNNNNTTVSSSTKKELKEYNQRLKDFGNVFKHLEKNIDFLNAKAFCAFMSNVEHYELLKTPAKTGHPLASFLLAKIYFRKTEISESKTSSRSPIMSFDSSSLKYLNQGFKQCNLEISEQMTNKLIKDENKLLLPMLLCSPPYTYNCLTKISFDNFCFLLKKIKQLPNFSTQKTVNHFMYIRFMSKLINEFDIEKLKDFSNSDLETQFNSLTLQMSEESEQVFKVDELYGSKSSGQSSKRGCAIS